MNNYKTLILSGGGMKAVSIIGTLKYFEEENILKDFKTFIGTSAGAIIAYLIIIGYTSSELTEVISKIDPSCLIKNNIENFFTNYGAFNVCDLVELIESMAKQKNTTLKITFKEHFKKFHKNLKIIGTNLTKTKSECFSYKITPNMNIYKAIEITMAVPYIFYPINYNDNLYCDGGISCNVPFKYSKNKNESLAIIYNIQETTKCDNIFSYFYAFVSIASNDIKMLRKYKYNCLNLYLDRHSAFKFNQSEKDKLASININYLLTKQYFNRRKILYKYFNLLKEDKHIFI
jgi:predicted acylesterase/phospholipase RssA|tara:strand:+ start:2944 stop:3810 length:867 start_codon:yes stop_codon:yes gene_type:complete